MQQRYWLAAMYWQGMGLKTWQHLLPSFRDLKEVFTCDKTYLYELGLTETLVAARDDIDWGAVDKNLSWANKPQSYVLTYEDPLYPALLRNISSPPLVLFARGNIKVLETPSLAIVGARQPSAVGKETAFAFAQASAALGLSVVSGLAYGIDAAAHRGALAVDGPSIAVLGSGLDRIYPKAHLSLSHDLAEQGILISEFSPDTGPQGSNFPRRNRIISGLSQGVLVIEAAAHSGSLITARYALEQGKEVFAVPGSIYNHLTRGCHLLIRQGAKLVESIQDIVEELSGTVDFFNNNRHDVQLLGGATHRMAALTSEQQALWRALDDAPNSIDQLLARSELSLTQLRHSLVRLELQGYARAVPGGYQRSWPL